MTAEADDALDVLWAAFFRLRAGVAAGATPPGDALARLRELHGAAGRTGSAHVPVFRAEVRGEILRIKAGG